MYGLAIKLVFADRIIGIINAIYSNYDTYTRYNIVAVLSYPLYIYADFAGYSFIAEGVGKLFGYDLVRNFKQPYFSISTKEFWNRWHCSLNNWLRTYIYIPLGGNKKGKVRKYLNIMIVFMISGIWHGAGPGFMIWGFINGAFQIVGDLLNPLRERANSKFHLNHLSFSKEIKMLTVFLLISLTWVFFSQGTDAFSIIASVFLERKLSVTDFVFSVCADAQSSKIELLIIALSFLLLVFVDIMEEKNKGCLCMKIEKSAVLRFAVFLLLFFFILLFGRYGSGYDASNFVYFDF